MIPVDKDTVALLAIGDITSDGRRLLHAGLANGDLHTTMSGTERIALAAGYDNAFDALGQIIFDEIETGTFAFVDDKGVPSPLK